MELDRILRSSATHYGVGAVVGVGASYIYTKWRKKKGKNASPKPENKQLSFLDESGRVREAVVVTPETLSHNDELVRLLNEEETSENEEDNEPIHRNVFGNSGGEWDYDQELTQRDPSQPYIIHQDEYISNEMGFHQETITYYVGDDTMVDSLDTPIYDYRQIMGDLKWGHGSNDANVVYIRYEPQRIEWEVLRHTGHYAHEVLGHDMDEIQERELRHSSSLVQKFRDI